MVDHIFKDVPDLVKIRELIKIVDNSEILVPDTDFSDKLEELDYALKLYESIKNKKSIPDETLKGVGIYYLYSEKREKPLKSWKII
jgi:hypothetical protein